MTRRPLFAVIALAAAALLGGCATLPSVAPVPPSTDANGTADPSAPGSTDIPQPRAAYLDDGRSVAIVLWGGCPPTAESVDVEGQQITVQLADPGDIACTEDMGPRPFLIGTSEPLNPSVDAVVTVRSANADVDQLEIPLAGVDGLQPVDGSSTEYTPSATWLGPDLDGESTLVGILTWGSGSCPPIVGGVTVTGTDAATVTFEEPPADRVCTMDMAPRLTLTAIAGIEPGATLTLNGDSIEAELAIIGG